jgi:16S rRNA (guanine966-N2)-methyltransferase
MTKGQYFMRVTGGQARGRILKVPDTNTVRPTSDKMRQMLFNMLAHSVWATQASFELLGAHVLDGFCGTGALGIEALSRGAASCIFIDHDGRVLQTAQANVKACGYEGQSQFLIKGCHNIAARPEKIPPRQLVLIDPPYHKDFVPSALTSLIEGKWLAPDALVIAETEKGWAGQIPEALDNIHVRIDGDSQLNVWYFAS